MKLRVAVSVLALAAAPLTACSSSGGGGTPSVGGSVAVSGGGVGVTGGATVAVTGGGSSGDFCSKLTDANNKLSGLSGSVSGGDFGALKAAIDEEISAYQGLASGAPSDVKPAIDDIVSVLQSAETALADPAHPDIAKLQGLSTKLPTDVQKLGTYVAGNCSGG